MKPRDSRSRAASPPQGSPPPAGAQQPDFPAREVRLLAVERTEGTVTLRLDDGRVLELAPRAVPGDLPPPGEVVPQTVLAAAAAGAARKLAARRLLQLLDKRLLPEARLRRMLEQDGHPAEAVQAVLRDMKEQGLCSDQQFAQAYCRDCLRAKAVGRRYLVAKLRDKGIPASIAAEAAALVLDGEQERLSALAEAGRRWARAGGAADPQTRAKIVRFLIGRGFAPGLAAEAARRTCPGAGGPRTREQEEP